MTSTPSRPPQPTLDRFFDTLRRLEVRRPKERAIAGVCAGVAQRTGASVGLVRMAAVLLGILGVGVFLYLAAWLLLPRYDGQIRLEQAVRRGDPASVVLLVVTAIALVPDLGRQAYSGMWMVPVGVVLTVVVLLIVLSLAGVTPRRGRSTSSSSSASSPASSSSPSSPSSSVPPTGGSAPTAGPQDAPPPPSSGDQDVPDQDDPQA